MNKKRSTTSIYYKRRQFELNDKARLKTRVAIWKLFRAYGDIDYISKRLGVGIQVISRAINSGNGSYRTLKYIDKFYQKRENMIMSEYLQK